MSLLTSNSGNSPRLARSQRGQASLFVVVFIAVVLIALVGLYKTGKLTSEKMELQNAADAVAYSISVLEARDLNYAAYTNRAMVANEVGIGQMIGLASLPRHVRSVGHYTDAFCVHRVAPIGNALISGFGTTMCKGVQAISKLLINGGKKATPKIDNVAAGLAMGLHGSNDFISIAQTIYHLATLMYITNIVQDDGDIIKSNDPDARLSGYGLNAMLAHLNTFGLNPLSKGKFTRTYTPTDQKGDAVAAFERMASVVRASRDEFSRYRGWTLELIDLHPRWNPSLTIPLGPASVTFGFDFKMDLDLDIARLGGSELRHVGNKAVGNKFNWSSADTTGMNVYFYVSIKAYVRFELDLKFTKIRFGRTFGPFELKAKDDHIKLTMTIPLPNPVPDITFELPPGKGLPFPTSAPFGAAGAQFATRANTLKRKDLKNIPNTSPDSYGGAAAANFSHKKAWKGDTGPFGIPAYTPTGTEALFRCTGPFPAPCFVPTVDRWLPKQRISNNKVKGLPKDYKGLKRYIGLDPAYTGTTATAKHLPFEGPQVVVALEKDQDKLFSTNAPQPKGQLELEEKSANNVMGALAKGEVYFNRPLASDLAYFARLDKHLEVENEFNPYWQARLGTITHADGVNATLLQQNIDDVDDSAPVAYYAPFKWDLLNWVP